MKYAISRQLVWTQPKASQQIIPLSKCSRSDLYSFSITQALRIATPPHPLHQRHRLKKEVKIEIQKLILHCLLYNIPNRGYQMHGQSEPRWSGSAITPEAIKSWRDWGLHWSNHTVSSHQNEHTNIDLEHKKHKHLNSFSEVVTGYYHIHFSPFSISL